MRNNCEFDRNTTVTGIGIRYTADDDIGTFMCLCTDGKWHPIKEIHESIHLVQKHFKTRAVAENRINLEWALHDRKLSDYNVTRIHSHITYGKMQDIMDDLSDV